MEETAKRTVNRNLKAAEAAGKVTEELRAKLVTELEEAANQNQAAHLTSQVLALRQTNTEADATIAGMERARGDELRELTATVARLQIENDRYRCEMREHGDELRGLTATVARLQLEND